MNSAWLALLVVLAGWVPAAGQTQPASPEKPGSSAQARPGRHENEFLLFGTVFTEQGFAQPGARIRVRRADERKYRWEAYSNSRGEFSVRVPRGAEYEMSVTLRGVPEQTRRINARSGGRADLAFRMTRSTGEKRK